MVLALIREVKTNCDLAFEPSFVAIALLLKVKVKFLRHTEHVETVQLHKHNF